MLILMRGVLHIRVANMNQVAKSQRILGDFGGYVGPLLGHFRAMLGCWAIWGFVGGFRG